MKLRERPEPQRCGKHNDKPNAQSHPLSVAAYQAAHLGTGLSLYILLHSLTRRVKRSVTYWAYRTAQDFQKLKQSIHLTAIPGPLVGMNPLQFVFDFSLGHP